MAKIIGEIKDLIRTLYDEKGLTYSEINRILLKDHKIKVSDDAIRYHSVRKDRDRKITKIKGNGGKITRALSLSDLHVPHHNIKEITDIIDIHIKNIDILILNGDILDCGEVSKFATVGTIPLDVELIEGHNLLRILEEKYPSLRKIVTIGNHELRWSRSLKNVPSYLSCLSNVNVIKLITSGFSVFDHVEGVENVYRELKTYEVMDNWFFQYNDTIFCHPLSFSSIKGRTLTMAIDYFINQGYKFNAIVVAHTHQKAAMPYKGKMGYEQGCVCDDMAYATSGRLKYMPQDKGYILIEFDDGIISRNNTKTYYLD